jgi:hypothetical protein
MALPQETAKLDPINGYQIPQSTNNYWANLSAWGGWTKWGTRSANSMVVVSTVQDRGSVGYYNLKTSTDVTGNITYKVYASNTGAFAGEETITNITPNTGNIAAFCSRYYAVVANVTEPSGGAVLRSMSVTSINSRFDIQLDDLVLGNLSGNINQKVLPLPRPVSAITNIQVTPHYESAEYVEDGYVQTYSVGTYTTLKTVGGIGANTSSMAVGSISGFQNSRHLIVMDNEVMAYTGHSSSSPPWPVLNNLERGLDTAPEFGNTSPTFHLIETEVQLYETITFNAPYFTNDVIIGTPFVISKDRQAPAITLKSNVGLGVGGTVDVRLSVLPEQYMDEVNLNTR